MSPNESEYERGVAAGSLQASVADHRRRLDAINGSITLTATNLAALTVQIAELVRVTHLHEETREKYVPIVEALEKRRLLGLKRWHLLAAAAMVMLPQALNLILRVAGV